MIITSLYTTARAFLSRRIFLRRFRERFPDSQLTPMGIFPLDVLSVGRGSYGEINITTFDNKTHLSIGSYVSIGQQVHFLLDAGHPLDHISTYPFRVKTLGYAAEATSRGDITVGDDVWIGFGAIILSGVHIGQGAVVAAGAVVTRDVAPYTVVGGVPAKPLRKRFDDALIKKLLNLDFSRLTPEQIRLHEQELYLPLESAEQLDWLPRRDAGE